MACLFTRGVGQLFIAVLPSNASYCLSVWFIPSREVACEPGLLFDLESLTGASKDALGDRSEPVDQLECLRSIDFGTNQQSSWP
jgi:hypothetical protein